MIEANRKAFEIRGRLVEQDPTNSSYLGDLSSTINNTGVLLAEEGERAQGLEMYRHAVRYVDSAFELAPYSMQYGRFAATTRKNIAISASALGFKDEAVRYYQSSQKRGTRWQLIIQASPLTRLSVIGPSSSWPTINSELSGVTRQRRR